MRILGLMAAALAMLGSDSASAQPIVLPPPDGAFPIGRTQWVVEDRARVDPFTGSSPRHVQVVVWYPAAPTANGSTAPYLVSGLDEAHAFGAVFGNRAMFDALGGVATHAIVDAEPQPGTDKLPLLVFSHGYTSVASSSTALLEDLASRGYIVVSIVHPFEAAAAAAGGGTVATMVDAAGKFRAPILDVFAEWKDEDKILGEITAAADDARRLVILRGYLETLRNTHVALRRWVDDTRAVMTALPSLSGDSAVARVMHRADFSRFGVFGHSMGGVTAAEFCLAEPRCAAVLNLDGSPQYGAMIDARLGRPLLMVYSARKGRLGASDVVYSRSASRYYRADVSDTLHLDFTDMVLWPPLRERKALGAIVPERAVAVTRAIVREFFDQELRGRRSPLLAGEQQIPDVTIRLRP